LFAKFRELRSAATEAKWALIAPMMNAIFYCRRRGFAMARPTQGAAADGRGASSLLFRLCDDPQPRSRPRLRALQSVGCRTGSASP
jgi:hypothetical protein